MHESTSVKLPRKPELPPKPSKMPKFNIRSDKRINIPPNTNFKNMSETSIDFIVKITPISLDELDNPDEGFCKFSYECSVCSSEMKILNFI